MKNVSITDQENINQTYLRYHFIPIKIATLKIYRKEQVLEETWRNWNFPSLLGGIQEHSLTSPKTQHVYPKSSTEKSKNINLDTCTAVFKAASFTRAVGNNHPNANQQMDKQNVAYTYNETFLNIRRNDILAGCYRID